MLTKTSLPQAKPIVKRQRKATQSAPKVPYLLRRLERKDNRPLEVRMLWA